MFFTSKHPPYEYLRKKWIGKQKDLSDNILDKHGDAIRRATIGGLSGLMVLSTPGSHLLSQNHLSLDNQSVGLVEDRSKKLSKILEGSIPSEMRSLSGEEEAKIGQELSEAFGMKVVPQINGMRLNRSYGMIGGEQHLYRYPGDTLESHADNATDWAMYGRSGIAPGLGAWGYFAPSKAEFDEQDKQREKYYLAVQTFLAPGFSENVGKYRDFFKYRKMLVVNPKTGQAVVAVIGDAGPAEWTGKHLGGSPEVMHHVGLAGGPRKGAVLYFFIDDPEDQVALGPIQMDEGRALAGK